MKMFKKLLLFAFLNFQCLTFAQLGFCNGSSGEPIFFENFGSGTNYGPALPADVTNYTYVNSGFPNDGQYTLFYRTNLIPNNWLYALDHTPDNQTNGVNGKCLIVNASNTPGQFYKRIVSGLCSNTTFEFSAWLLNILNSGNGGGCGGNMIPINVTFEIWDSTDSILLQSGNTGNINATSFPNWTQFGLVFTMGAGETSVILKMRNNGSGGCGNDLAIDDIMFRACGEFSTATSIGTTLNSTSICQNETLVNNTLQVTTTGTASNVYQWQQSYDNVNYTDISGAISDTYTFPSNLTNTTYYRTKVAGDIVNINNPFCTTSSEIFTVNVNSLPNAPISNGNQTLCSNQPTLLGVSVNFNESVNWYDASVNGNLLLTNSLTFSSTSIGTYFAETYNLTTGCKSETRTALTLSPTTTVSSSGTIILCSNETTAINLVASDTNAIINWVASSSNVTGFSNGTGNSINQTLIYTGNTYGTVTYIIKPVLNGCEGTNEIITVTVNPLTTSTPTFNALTSTYCINATPDILPTTSSNSNPISGTWSPATINTSIAGTATYTFIPQANSCINYLPYSLSITISDNTTPDFEDTISFCSGTTPPTLENTSPNGISGVWNPTAIDNTTSGSYLFTPNPNQCAIPKTIDVKIFEATLSSIEYTTSGAFSENQIITVIAYDEGDYVYKLDNGNFQISNIFSNVSSGTHTITVKDQNGCSIPLQKEVLLIDYPHFFSPNGDAINDIWKITGINNLINPKISIFNRFGKLLIQIKANNFGWDGTFNGKKLPADDYWFIIDYTENNSPKTFKSHFSLTR